MKKIILISIIVILITMIVYATPDINFWRSSRLDASDHGDGYQYVPIASQFTQNGCGSGTVLDNKHNLCWDANGNRFGFRNWTDANNDCANLNLGDIAVGNWRLPTVNELLTLVKSEGSNSGTLLNGLGVGFSNYQNAYYWTGDLTAQWAGYAWIVYLSTGYVDYHFLTYARRVVCVSRN